MIHSKHKLAKDLFILANPACHGGSRLARFDFAGVNNLLFSLGRMEITKSRRLGLMLVMIAAPPSSQSATCEHFFNSKSYPRLQKREGVTWLFVRERALRSPPTRSVPATA